MPIDTSGLLAAPGLGSGLDVNALVSKLMAVERQPLTAMTRQEASYSARITAYGNLKGALAAFQSSLSGLTSASGMKTVLATVADASVASATVGAGAAAGSYAIEVGKLAQAHKIASAGFASTSSVVGSGTLTFTFGTLTGAAGSGSFAANADVPAKTVTIGAGQNTLAGIRDAVNAAKVGVTATIVNDGQSQGNRLVFTSSATGAANGLKVSVDDGDSTDTDATGLSQLAYDAAAGGVMRMSEKISAQNAELVVDGIAISKASNTVTDAVQGVTLTLLKTNVDAPTTLTVASDSSGVTKSVQAFVKAYNDLAAGMASLTKYDPVNKRGSVLTGDTAPRMIQSQLRSIMGTAMQGSGLTLTTLSQVGVSHKVDGTLSLDATKLASAIASDASAVTRLFATVGTATDSLVTLNPTGTTAIPGDYALEVTRIATQGKAVGESAAALTINAGGNDSLTVSVNGTSATVTLSPGTYTAASLAAEMQIKVNGASALLAAGASVTVSAGDTGILTLASNRYGASSTVAVSGNAATPAFGAAAVTAGVDVAGTIGGQPASGSGQTLTGGVGSDTEGLQVVVAGGSTGPRGEVNYTQGFAWRLDQAITRLLASDGPMTSGVDRANKGIKDIASRRDAFELRMQKKEATYLAQFRALDLMISRMATTSTYLAQQLDNLPGSANTRN